VQVHVDQVGISIHSPSLFLVVVVRHVSVNRC
jgi:hypothetical protein